ncbi:MAG: rhomboid family intramembrane serine protease [Chthoniobacterales bacterium]|nr:rhomboid family intramembrane serine protease [Chthoniobacterales bacterium]
MLDLNHILLFVALASPVILLWRLQRLHGARPVGWTAAAIIVLLGSGISWLLAPSIAGFIGGGIWALLLLAPSLAERKIAVLLVEKRYRSARRLALVRRVLHPWNDPSQLSSLLRVLELARDGQLPAALERLATQRSETTSSGRAAMALTYALTENWAGLVEWCRRDLSVTNDPAVRTLYLRALGETGALKELTWDFAARSQSLEPRLTISPPDAQELLYLLAFCGRTRAVARLFRGVLARFPRAHQQLWIATAELAEGKMDAAVARLTKLRGRTRDAILEGSIARRLDRAHDFPIAHISPSTDKLLTRLIAETGTSPASPASRSPHRPVAVWAFILLNIVMFGAELALGGATNVRTLHRLGALEPDALLMGHQYWRLLSALFLHYGVLHILFNLYALYLLGPALERLIGSTRFALGYLLSGLGSSAGVVLLRAIGLTKADQLVGASGCVMGVIGISAGLLLRHRQTPLAGRRLREILAIVAFQTIFDLSTPQVSLAAHLSGFATGVLVGLVFAARGTA